MALRQRLSIHTYRLTSLQCSSYQHEQLVVSVHSSFGTRGHYSPETVPSIKLDRLKSWLSS